MPQQPGTVRVKDRGLSLIFDNVKRLQGFKLLIGVQGPEAEAIEHDGDATNIEIALWNEYGTGTTSARSGGTLVHTPERSFIRSTFDKKVKRWLRLMVGMARRAYSNTFMRPKRELGILGEAAVGDIRGTIRAGIPPPNAPSTIRRKGSSKPLIDTGQLVGSITWRIDNWK